MRIIWAAILISPLVSSENILKAQGTLVPTYLRCEDRVNPLGIGNATPELSWQLQSSGSGPAYRGEIQSAYEIQVGSTPGAADLWDSGKLASSQTSGIIYGGQTLTTGEQCYWQVQVYDGSGNASAWSATAKWTMGLLNETNWTAQWIGYDGAYNLTSSQATNNALFNTSGLKWIGLSGQTQEGGNYELALRKQVVMPAGQTITNAVMALYADNFCNVYVNGQEMTNSTMTGYHPGASAMRWEATAWINVTPWLSLGTNLLALNATSSDAQEPAAVIGQLVVQFANGSVSNVPVDTSWSAASWPSGNWTQTNYNASGWATPSSSGTSWGTPALNDIARVPAPFLRKNFVVTQAVTRATVYVTALGSYELHLNGQKVGNDVMTPGWSDFSKRVYYQTYDVTGMVQPGSNIIGAILGDGWYASDLAYVGHRQFYGGMPRFLAQLVLQLSDGSTQTIVTDGSWMSSYGPIQWGDILLGSEYDARLEMRGWDTTNFNASAWSPVATGLRATSGGYTNVTALVQSLESNNQLNFVVNNTTMGGDPAYGILKTFRIIFTLGGTNETLTFGENATVQIGNGILPLTVIQALYGNAAVFPGLGGMQIQAAVTEPSQPLQMLPALSLTQPAPGAYTFDLGQNMVGWAQLNISGSVGDRITVRYGEMLNPDGTIYTANLRGATATDYYLFGTNGAVTFQPRFTYHGFRYVEVRGLSVPPTTNSVTGIVVHSVMQRTGNFSCSDSLVNQLYSNIIWGNIGNYLEVPTDCPQRDERMGWTGDMEFFVPTAAYNFDVQSFFRRELVALCQDSQQSDGSFANVAPNLNAGSDAAGWGDAGWICPYNMYRAYGDTNVIVDNYASFKTYGQFLAANATNYTVPHLSGDYGDWLNLGGGASQVVIDTSFYAYYSQAMSEMAAAIGNTEDAASYATLHSNIVAAYANFFNSDGSFVDGSGQTGYALAITLNLVPPALQSQVAQQFANSIAAFNGHLATGFIGTPRLLLALHDIGRDDLAYTVLLQQTYPSWLYQVTLGSTTMWERWDGWTPTAGFQSTTMNSFNHYAFGSVGQYLYGVVGGISPASPAYKSIVIRPVPGNGLTWANASYDSTPGLISTAWTNPGSVFNLAVTIPPNATAEVYVPTTNAAAITESGQPAGSSPGVTYVGLTNGCAIYSVGSGDYLWSSPYAVSTAPGVVITTTNETGSGSGTFYPTWTVQTNGSLIAGQAPSATSGNFSEEAAGRSVYALTTSNNLGLTQIHGPYGITTSTNYVTCGNGTGPDGSSAGSEIVYTLPATAGGNGYNLTNITVYGGWADNGRDQQAYTVYYSTVANPGTFIQLAVVSYTPQAPGGVQSATRVALTSTAGVLASGVAALMFNFTNPPSENGYCGYAAITVFGTAVPPLNETMNFQLGNGTGTFYPSWTVNTNGSLLNGQLPSDSVGDFSLETPGRSLASLTIENSLGLAHIVGNPSSEYPISTTTNYLTCGNGSGAGSLLVYVLNGPPGGYNLTNITVYGGWADNGRDQQAYTVYYSTTAAPTNFLLLGIANFLPPNPASVQCATRLTLAPVSGVLASNVAEVKFDFTSPPSTNGFCGYAAITLFGTPNVTLPLVGNCALLNGQGGLVINFNGLVSGQSYALESTTNLASPVWITETNFMAAQSSSAAFTNARTTYTQKFYRLVGN